ncbi:MAG: hypothetical protein IT395_03730 [Candidatus Omnitrophica bacterium]|nr:hypothetical protein [Candidatus Omnitrophota bacterium]
MDRFFSVIMYILWTATIIAILSTTFTNFQYFDLNVLAGLLLFFAVINSIFMAVKKK